MAQKVAQLTVANYMTPKPITVSPDVSFFTAVTTMYKQGIGNLVVKKEGKVTGLITEREILQYLVNEQQITDKPMSHIATHLFSRVSPETTLLDAAKTMVQEKRKLLVFDNEKFVGIITTSDILRGLRTLSITPSLDDVIRSKVYSCLHNDPIFDQVKLMHEKRIGSVIVTKDERPYGIFTERDLICNLLAIESKMDEEVGRYCSTPLMTANFGINALEAALIMADKKIKRLPLIKNGKIASIVCATDLLRSYSTKQFK